jgi:hypothetical protein
MKKILLLIAVTLLAISPVFAKRDETVTLRVGQQTTTKLGKLTIRFVGVDSDSRCPINARCIWAGNARVKISVAKGRKRATAFDLNSMLKPDVISYAGYDIRFVDLTPRPGEEQMEDSKGGAPNKSPSKGNTLPGLTISITKQA